mgnify:CR=1 FL=1
MRYAHWLRQPDSPDWRRRRERLTTPEVFERVFDLLRTKVGEVLDQTEQLIAVLHTTPFSACVNSTTTPDPFAAYGGSDKLGELLVELSTARQVHCLCGHQHSPIDVTVNGVRVLRSPVGYLHGPPSDCAGKAEEALGILTL